jgi:hypothetical protein
MGLLQCSLGLAITTMFVLGTTAKVAAPRWTPAVVRLALENAGVTVALPEVLTAAQHCHTAIADALHTTASLCAGVDCDAALKPPGYTGKMWMFEPRTSPGVWVALAALPVS